jgi:hypothetical protein
MISEKESETLTNEQYYRENTEHIVCIIKSLLSDKLQSHKD